MPYFLIRRAAKKLAFIADLRTNMRVCEWCHPSLARFSLARVSLTRASLARCILTRSQYGVFQFGAFHFGAFSNFLCMLIQLIQYSMHFCFIVYVIYLLIISTRHRYSIANLFIAGGFVCLVHTFINHFRTIFIREDQGEVITSD